MFIFHELYEFLLLTSVKANHFRLQSHFLLCMVSVVMLACCVWSYLRCMRVAADVKLILSVIQNQKDNKKGTSFGALWREQRPEKVGMNSFQEQPADNDCTSGSPSQGPTHTHRCTLQDYCNCSVIIDVFCLCVYVSSLREWPAEQAPEAGLWGNHSVSEGCHSGLGENARNSWAGKSQIWHRDHTCCCCTRYILDSSNTYISAS